MPGSSCCSWAGSTSPVCRAASAPSSVCSVSIRQALLRGSWHGGGGCTTSSVLGLLQSPPEEENNNKKNKKPFPQPELCPTLCCPAADLPAPMSSVVRTWLRRLSLDQAAQVVSNACPPPADKLSLLASPHFTMQRCPLSSLCAGFVSLTPAAGASLAELCCCF